MKKAVIVWFVVSLALPSLAADEPSRPRDKAWHFAAGFFISLNVGAVKPRLGLALGCAAGVAKEVYDSQQRGNRFDVKDMLATTGGAAAGYGLARLLFHRKSQREQKISSPTLRSTDNLDRHPIRSTVSVDTAMDLTASTAHGMISPTTSSKDVQCALGPVSYGWLTFPCDPTNAAVRMIETSRQ